MLEALPRAPRGGSQIDVEHVAHRARAAVRALAHRLLDAEGVDASARDLRLLDGLLVWEAVDEVDALARELEETVDAARREALAIALSGFAERARALVLAPLSLPPTDRAMTQRLRGVVGELWPLLDVAGRAWVLDAWVVASEGPAVATSRASGLDAFGWSPEDRVIVERAFDVLAVLERSALHERRARRSAAALADAAAGLEKIATTRATAGRAGAAAAAMRRACQTIGDPTERPSAMVTLERIAATARVNERLLRLLGDSRERETAAALAEALVGQAAAPVSPAAVGDDEFLGVTRVIDRLLDVVESRQALPARDEASRDTRRAWHALERDHLEALERAVEQMRGLPYEPRDSSSPAVVAALAHVHRTVRRMGVLMDGDRWVKELRLGGPLRERIGPSMVSPLDKAISDFLHEQMRIARDEEERTAALDTILEFRDQAEAHFAHPAEERLLGHGIGWAPDGLADRFEGRLRAARDAWVEAWASQRASRRVVASAQLELFGRALDAVHLVERASDDDAWAAMERLPMPMLADGSPEALLDRMRELATGALAVAARNDIRSEGDDGDARTRLRAIELALRPCAMIVALGELGRASASSSEGRPDDLARLIACVGVSPRPDHPLHAARHDIGTFARWLRELEAMADLSGDVMASDILDFLAEVSADAAPVIEAATTP